MKGQPRFLSPRPWPLLLLAFLALACAPPPPPRHSILLVTLDTTRADRFGAYGAARGLTATFDALADQGVLFQRSQAQAAVTPVSHASLFTGLNPYRHGLRTLHGNRRYRLEPGAVTLAERFQALGYETAAFVSAFPCSRRFGLEQGFAHFDDQFSDGARVGAAGNVSTGLAQRGAATTTDAVLAWLAGRARDRPFFLWVHYFDAHDPLLRPPPSFTAPFLAEVPEHEEMERLIAEDMERFVAQYASQPDKMRPWLRHLYDAEVAWADAQLGRILREIRGTGQAPDLLVAVTADHGEGLGDHGWWGHGILYQEQLHVPLALAGPGLPAGLRIADPVRLIDVAPTLLELAARDRFEAGVEGISLVPLIQARAAGLDPAATARPGPAYADAVTLMRYGAVFSRDVVEDRDDQLYAWIEGDMKWIRHRLRPPESELYDLAADPHEADNLYAARPELAARLDAALEAVHPMTEELDFSLPEDPETRRRLRSLGYVD